MQVKNLQPFLADLGRFLETSGGGKTVAKDFHALSEALAPFAEMKIPQLCDFLQKAEEYQRTGIVSSGRKTRATKSIDQEKVMQWTQRLSQLREDAISEDVTYSQIESEIKAMAKANKKPELDAIAKELGLSSKFSKKADAQKAIHRLISERKESFQRTQFGSPVGGN